MDLRANSAVNVETFTATGKDQSQTARAAAADVEEWYNHLHSSITFISISTTASVAMLQFEPRYSFTITIVWMEIEDEVTSMPPVEAAAGAPITRRARRTREAA